MPEENLDVKVSDADSSTAAENATADVKQETDSSKSQDVKEQSLGDVVSSVLDKYKEKEETKPEETAKDSSTEEKEEGLVSDPNQTSEKKEEVKVEEAKDEPADQLPPEDEKKHEDAVPYSRFEEVNKRVKDLEEPATRMRAIETFCQQKGIAPDDFQAALDFMAALREDPKKARTLLQPIVEQLDVVTGAGLPADLSKEVEDGLITAERAKELAMLRLSKNGLEQGSKLDAEQRERSSQQALANALNTWDSSKRQVLPDFKPKSNGEPDGIYEVFQAKFMQAWQSTPVKSIEDAIALAEKAFKDTMGFVERFKPAPKVQKMIKSTGSSKTAEPVIDSSKPGWARKVAAQVTSRY